MLVGKSGSYLKMSTMLQNDKKSKQIRLSLPKLKILKIEAVKQDCTASQLLDDILEAYIKKSNLSPPP